MVHPLNLDNLTFKEISQIILRNMWLKEVGHGRME